MASVNTQVVVADYIKYRLLQEDLEWSSCPDLPEAGPVQVIMRALGMDAEQRQNGVFQATCNLMDITENTAHSQIALTRIMNGLFKDGIQWSTVVVVLSFAGYAAVQCMQKEIPALVSQIVDWITNYFNNKLNTWIAEQGGWSAFVHDFDRDAVHRDDSPWPLYAGCTVGCAVAFLLGYTLCSITLNRTW